MDSYVGDDTVFETEDYDALWRNWLPGSRLKYLWKYGWARLSEANLDSIIEFTKETGIIELGGGSGYIAHLLRKKGANIVCYDTKNPKEDFSVQETWNLLPCEKDVIKGNEDEIADHLEKTVLLVWPHQSLVREVLPLLPYVSKFIYVGEMCDEDGHGLCISQLAFDAVEKIGFRVVREPQDIDNFPYQYGKLLFFELSTDGASAVHYPVPKLSWKESYERHANQGFLAAEYYMSVKQVKWYVCALYGLQEDFSYAKLGFEKSHPASEVFPEELKAKFENKIQECLDTLEELSIKEGIEVYWK